MGHNSGRKIVPNAWRVCLECGHIGRVLNPVQGVPCACMGCKNTVLVFGERPVLKTKQCPECGEQIVSIGDSFKNHVKACREYNEKIRVMREDFFKKHPTPTLKDIFPSQGPVRPAPKAERVGGRLRMCQRGKGRGVKKEIDHGK